MPDDRIRHLLLLAGTAEASALDRALAGNARWQVTVSLAGVTRQPGRFSGTARSGGFGGHSGFAQFLAAAGVDAIINATHPFAAKMSATVGTVARQLGLPAVRLLRPEWQPPAGSNWLHADDLAHAARLLPPDATGFLALGQRHLDAFRDHPARLLVRSLEGPPPGLLPGARWVIAPPGRTSADEAHLFARAGVTHLVARNSGGAAGWPKIAAAASTGLPTIMVRRPVPGPGPVLETVQDVLAWLQSRLAGKDA